MKLFWKKDPRKKKGAKSMSNDKNGKTDLSFEGAAKTLQERKKKTKKMLEELEE
jgi:hypothetical protein